jgi:Protein of unknown function (DUF1203)
MPFRYRGLSFAPFERLVRMSDTELQSLGARRMIVDEKPSFPCRVTLADAELGESVLLLSYTHQPADTPYKAAGPIFVREDVRETYDSAELPPVCRAGRLLSARAYNANGMMVDADVSSSEEIEPLLSRLFARGDTDYIHIHSAKRGCFLACVERA